MLDEYFPADFKQMYPDQLLADCTLEQAEQLIRFDHHRVEVQGKSAIMLTYHWARAFDARSSGPYPLLVLFYHQERHPPAPPAVQEIINQLVFRPA